MRVVPLFGLTILTTGLFACATGGKFNGSGGSGEGGSGSGGEGGSPTTTSAPAGGGGAGTTSGTTVTTASTSTTTTTTTPACDESPCKLVSPQCGCADGDMCSINASGDRTCHKPGAAQVDQECVGLYSCAAGSLCITASTTKSLCTSYCDDDAQCGGGVCVLQLNDPADPEMVLPDLKLCSNHCNPINGTGCPSGLGLGCHLYLYEDENAQQQTFTLCAGSGTGSQGAACTDSEDCAPGSACFTFTDGTTACLQYCNVDNPACGLCQELDPPFIYAGVNYGACL